MKEGTDQGQNVLGERKGAVEKTMAINRQEVAIRRAKLPHSRRMSHKR